MFYYEYCYVNLRECFNALFILSNSCIVLIKVWAIILEKDCQFYGATLKCLSLPHAYMMSRSCTFEECSMIMLFISMQ